MRGLGQPLWQRVRPRASSFAGQHWQTPADMFCRSGCDFNSYRMGDKEFYGEGKTVDTSSKFTVVTQVRLRLSSVVVTLTRFHSSSEGLCTALNGMGVILTYNPHH